MLSDNVLLHLARAIPVGATFSFNMCTLGVACNKESVQWIESKKYFLFYSLTRYWKPTWVDASILMVGSLPLPEISH